MTDSNANADEKVVDQMSELNSANNVEPLYYTWQEMRELMWEYAKKGDAADYDDEDELEYDEP